LVVLTEAVIRTGTRNIVFVALEGGRFEPREVIIGAEGEQGKLHIISGLLEGENIVISAQFMMDSESRLQEAIQKMLEDKSKKKSKTISTKNDKSELEDHQHSSEEMKMPEEREHNHSAEMEMDHSKMQHDTMQMNGMKKDQMQQKEMKEHKH
ncbi:MAG: hypothetical protein ABII90_06555, partial [Bacteroidota bacterium]